MTTQTMILELPNALYQKLKARAEQTHRTVEAEALDLLATSVPVADDLPADLEAAISPLNLLDDESLWRAARGTFPQIHLLSTLKLPRPLSRRGNVGMLD